MSTAGEKSNITLKPVSKIAVTKQVLASVSNGIDEKLMTNISNVVQGFIKGGSDNVVSGVTNGICTILKTMIGESTG